MFYTHLMTSHKTEGFAAVGAALLVLSSAMWSAEVSLVVSIAALLLLALNEFRKK